MRRLPKKNNVHGLILAALFACFPAACKDAPNNNAPLGKEGETISINEAMRWVEGAIERSGGFDTWKSKKNLAYTKHIQFYDSLGNLDRTVVQEHKYQLQPTFKANIKWQENGNLHEIVNTGRRAMKWINGLLQEDQKSLDGAWNSSFGSHYVISMPFKLKDSGTNLRYQGIKTIGEIPAHDIEVTYDKSAGSAGGIHIWHYYIDAETNELVANYLNYGDGHTYTSYHNYAEIQGISMPTQRRSHASNETKKPLQLRSKYTNTDIRFDVDFSEDLFDIRLPME